MNAQRKRGRPKGALSGPRAVPGKIDGHKVEDLLVEMLKLEPFAPFSMQRVFTVAREVLRERGIDDPQRANAQALQRAFIKAIWYQLEVPRFGVLQEQRRNLFADWWQANRHEMIVDRPEWD